MPRTAFRRALKPGVRGRRAGPVVLGLTGSIGMGKSAAARALRRDRIPVYDADRAVHRLLGPGGRAVAAVARSFPTVQRDGGGIDRQALGRLVFGDARALSDLEAILHPLVRAAEADFLKAIGRRRNRRRRTVAVLDIPLLFETGGARRCAGVLLVTAPPWLQRQRVMRRPAMTPARFAAILSHQMPDHDKRRRTRHLVQTGLGHRYSLNRLRRSVSLLRAGGRDSPP